MGILLIPAAEMRLHGADVIVLNVTAEEMAELKSFDDLRRLRAQRGDSIFTIAPHPFYMFGGSIGSRLFREIDCFDAIEFCHFHVGLFNPNRRAKRVASRFGKPLIATSDAHRLHAFGRHYTSIPTPSALTAENVFAALRSGPLSLTSPACSLTDLLSAIYFVFLAHPFRVRRKIAVSKRQSSSSANPDRALTRRRFRCQVVDCAPVARRYAPRGRFPWAAAPLIIRRLIATPENVADAQSLSSFAPVGRPTH